MKFINKHKLVVKILLGTFILWGIPVGIISNFAFQHLRTIKNESLQEARSALISSQINHLEHHLAQQADKISAEFSNIKNDVRFFGSLAGPIVETPTHFHYRSGSRYRFDVDGIFGNPTDDGHSRLFVPGYRPSMDPMIAATENLDIFLKPLFENTPSIVLGWFIHRDGISRTYPWRDFKLFPRDREATSWPFYFLAGPEYNPLRGEIFTPLYADPLTGDIMISCLSPIFVGDNHVATVGFDITVQKIIQDIRRVRLTENSSSLLLSDHEVLAASENLPLEEMGLSPENPPYGLNLAMSGLSEVGETIMKRRKEPIGIELLQIGENRVFMGYASLEPLGWRLVLLVPEADLVGPADDKVAAIFAGAERIRGNFLHILIFAMLAVMSVGWLVIAQQSKGLRTLLGGIREFAKGSLNHRICEEKSEFAELARALNTMAMSLQEKEKELQRVYAEVEQGRKLTAVGRLAAGIAHEVNNPLATISTYTQLLLRSDPPGETAARLGKIMKEIDRIQDKLRNLLDLSRLQSPVRTKVDPNLLVSDITDLACHEARALGIDLSLSLTESSQEISLDQSGFKQVLWNLLGNAFAAQGDGGNVRVTTRFFGDEGDAEFFTLEVEDEGPGIPDEVLPHIFDPFFTTKEVGQGTGLGLAVVNSIVEGHCGRIRVRNLSPKGCLFQVIFPVEYKE
jgi:signal transduction histidine kinase